MIPKAIRLIPPIKLINLKAPEVTFGEESTINGIEYRMMTGSSTIE